MTEPFDPYRKWLGIPAQDLPPHHYRLLGIEPFESDQDVICNAADARMAQIKTFQTGRHSDHSQRLLNELAAAKVCLLNPAKKAEYDRGLLEKREEGRERGEEPVEDEIAPIVVVSTKPSDYLARARRKRQPTWLMPSIAVGVVVLLAVVLALVFQETAADRRGTKRSGVAEKERPPVPSKSPALKPEKKPSEPQPAEYVPPLPVPEPREEPKPAPPVIHKPVEPQRPKPTRPKPPVSRPPSVRKKPPVPDAAAQREAESEIRSLFAKEFAAADNAKRKLALSATLRKQAGGTKNDPTARFVLYRLAGELAARAGDLAKGFAVIDRLARSYDVNPLTMKADLAAAVAPGYRAGIKTEESIADLWVHANTLMELADEAALRDDFPTAVRAAKLAVPMARATKDTPLLRETAARSRELEYRKSRFRAVKAAIGVLAENPDDAEANLTTGKWRCFTNGDWHRGLPLLAKCSDAELADLARRDLARPKTIEDQMALADAWFDAAAKESSSSKTGLQSRAVYWYEQVLPKLSGLDQTRVRKQLKELYAKDIYGSRIRGFAAKGNVALARRGATLSGIDKYPERLLDGYAKDSDGTSAVTRVGQPFTITLPRVYLLREIRLLLWNKSPRVYNYTISVSRDGKEFTLLADRSRGEWTSWQQISFSPRPVKAIRVLPIRKYHAPTKQSMTEFTIVELEAYCVPPANTLK